ncbi:MAG: SDR family NAD(P)-dependent oxidoreductase [Methanoregula sp.]|jgi:NADP-dependent 3-hydroxy acid dehydrogenase YdfG
MGKLDNKVAIVTGASSGMGKEIARLFAEEGASVVAIARRKEKLPGRDR